LRSLANIVIIDDDYALEILADNLRFRGHAVRRIASAAEALRDISKIASTDLIILDIIMECRDTPMEESISGGLATGMAVFRAVRSQNANIPILAYSATQDSHIIDVLKNDKNTRFMAKWGSPTLQDIATTVNRLLGVADTAEEPTVFIVHGHNDELKLQLKNYLQNVIGLPEPIILHEKPSMGKTIIEKFEEYAFRSNLAFVLLTPDDRMAVSTDTELVKRQARQNVIFEMGFFIGALGRRTGRVLLLHSGPLDLPSDLSGVIYIDISKGIEAAGEEIRRELNYVLNK